MSLRYFALADEASAAPVPRRQRRAGALSRQMSVAAPTVVPESDQRRWLMTADDKSKNGSALTPPAGADRNWQEKIAKAKAARDHGKALRAGKPTSFRSAVGRSH